MLQLIQGIITRTDFTTFVVRADRQTNLHVCQMIAQPRNSHQAILFAHNE